MTDMTAGPVMPGQVVYCQQYSCPGSTSIPGSGVRSSSRPAAYLMVFPSGEQCPSCEACARWWYNYQPHLTQVLPLNEYRDLFAEVVAAMSTTSTAQPPVPAPAIESALAGPQQRYSLIGFPQEGEPRPPMSRRGKLISAAVATAAGIAVGAALLNYGWHFNATQATYGNGEPGQGALVWAWILILTPLWIGLGLAIRGFARFTAEQNRRYKAWKASLPPEQRALVQMAEAAAAVAATAEMIHHAREMDRRNNSRVMGYTMPDAHSPRPSQRLAALRQQPADYQAYMNPLSREQLLADPNSAAHEALMRSHPEKRDPVTGQYHILG